MLLTPRLSVYLFKIGQKVHKGEYVPALMKCPECGVEATDFTEEQADQHVVFKQKINGKSLLYVAIGCEGYWTIDPKKLDLPRGNWQPVWEVIKRNIAYYIKEPKTYAPETFDEITEDNKPEIAAIINMDGRLSFGEKANLLKQLDD